MELDYLREFVALAKTCQFQETADQLFMSQSSLSKHIKVIEKELGAELLNRSTRRVELSEFGRAFLPYATQIAEIQRDYTLDLLADIHNQSKKITIGVIPLVTFYKLKGFLSYFYEKYPEYNVEFVEHDCATLRELLRKGECDLIIVIENPNCPDVEFNSVPYSEDTLVAVVPDNHPFAQRDTLSVYDLTVSPLIQLGKVNLSHHIDPYIPSAAFTVSRGSVLMDMVLRGMGIGILTRYAAKHFLAPGVKSIPLTPTTEIHMNMLYPKQKRKNFFATQIVLDYVRSRENEISDKQPE